MVIVRAKDRDGKIALYNLLDEPLKNKSENYDMLSNYAIALISSGKSKKEVKQIVKIISKPFSIENEIKSLNKIDKILSKEENNKIEELNKKSKKILPGVKELIYDEIKEEIEVLDCYYDYFENMINVIYYSPKRIDFRNIVKKLAKIYKARIEMKQINDKEYMANIGGIGECGRKLCCMEREELPNPTIKMVKMLGLNPKSVSVYGACGRIKCCIEYEYEAYKKAKEELPSAGDKIKYKEKEAKVIKVDVLTKNITLELKEEDTNNIKVVNLKELMYNSEETENKEVQIEKDITKVKNESEINHNKKSYKSNNKKTQNNNETSNTAKNDNDRNIKNKDTKKTKAKKAKKAKRKK